MENLKSLDNVLSELAHVIYTSCPVQAWQRITLYAKYSPGGVSSHNYDYLLADGSLDQSSEPDASARANIRELTQRHRSIAEQVQKSPWYKMVFSISNDGKYGADLEYKNDYQEGDLLQRR